MYVINLLMQRIGFATGYAPDATVRDMIGWIQSAEKRRFEMGFFSETINLVRDAVSALSSFSVSTQKIALGATQIVRLRSPLVMAQTMATLDELSGGRTVFAFGACTQSHAVRHGLEVLDPAAILVEYVESVRQILTGDEASYEGKFVKFKNIRLSFEPPRRRIPIWIAATSKTGLRIAGAVGDGVLLNTIASPDYSKNAVEIVRNSAREAGRNPEDLEVAQLIVAAASENQKEAIDAVRWEVANKFTPTQAGFNFRQKLRVGESVMKEEDFPMLQKAYETGGMEGLMRALPESYLTGLAACGTPDEVKERLGEYSSAKVRLPLVRPAKAELSTELIDLLAPD
ncbi:MAG: LLM class flavin-dependent oxidoreductase [Nitrososphaerota archaeon]|nr:LLM class flavin-dependent oxidoreductase [Nitrososphaerota archaeon]